MKVSRPAREVTSSFLLLSRIPRGVSIVLNQTVGRKVYLSVGIGETIWSGPQK